MKQARERRRGTDRRQSHILLRTHDRRKNADRRSIEVQEITFEEWIAQAAAVPQPTEPDTKRGEGPAKQAGRFFRRRAAEGRRQQALGPPPGRAERRQLADRRGLVVREISYAEFLKLLRSK